MSSHTFFFSWGVQEASSLQSLTVCLHLICVCAEQYARFFLLMLS